MGSKIQRRIRFIFSDRGFGYFWNKISPLKIFIGGLLCVDSIRYAISSIPNYKETQYKVMTSLNIVGILASSVIALVMMLGLINKKLETKKRKNIVDIFLIGQCIVWYFISAFNDRLIF